MHALWKLFFLMIFFRVFDCFLEPFSTSAFKVLMWIFATTAKICTTGSVMTWKPAQAALRSNSLFKTLIQKLSKTAFFSRQQGFPPARPTANNYKPAAGHAIKNHQLRHTCFFGKGNNCIQWKEKVVSLFKNSYLKAFKNSFFSRQQGFPPARCTANNYKPAGGHAINNHQLRHTCFFGKGSNCIQWKEKVVSSFKTLIQKLSKTAFFQGNKTRNSKPWFTIEIKTILTGVWRV